MVTSRALLVLPVLLCGVYGYPTTATSDKSGLPARTFYVEETLHRASDVPLVADAYLAVTETQRRNIERELQISSHPDITQVVTSRLGLSSEFNVRQDPPPLEDDLQRNRRKREADGEKSSEHYAEDDDHDDSDMYMEPREIEKTEPKRTQQVTTTEAAKITEIPLRTKDSQQMGQHFFPSFAPVFSLGHSRPHQLFHQEPFYSSKSRSPSSLGPDFNPFRAYRDSSYKIPITIDDDAISNNILGSGNFGVLRGGTFYNEDDEYGGLFSPQYSNNGHGRPYYSNPRPQKYSNGDFFSNFRDFADINTPTKASYSEYVVVYVNKNATKNDEAKAITPGEISRPKNIFEQLALLDQEEPLTSSEETVTEKKQSLHKRKLALLKQEKLNKQKKSYYKNKDTGKNFLEPLIALS